eukprot:COSAG06_NODE_8712_length_2090_cov_2.537418_2_plen_376_part_00
MKVQLLRLWLLWGSSHTPYDLSRCVTEHGLGGPKRNSRTPPTCEAALPLGETTVQVKARVAVIRGSEPWDDDESDEDEDEGDDEIVRVVDRWTVGGAGPDGAAVATSSRSGAHEDLIFTVPLTPLAPTLRDITLCRAGTCTKQASLKLTQAVRISDCSVWDLGGAVTAAGDGESEFDLKVEYVMVTVQEDEDNPFSDRPPPADFQARGAESLYRALNEHDARREAEEQTAGWNDKDRREQKLLVTQRLKQKWAREPDQKRLMKDAVATEKKRAAGVRVGWDALLSESTRVSVGIGAAAGSARSSHAFVRVKPLLDLCFPRRYFSNVFADQTRPWSRISDVVQGATYIEACTLDEPPSGIGNFLRSISGAAPSACA